jgi:predicted AlkP superfamily pyrophosphatase or phosphodiesterase
VELNLPQIWRAGTEDDRKLLRALATPRLLDRMEARLGVPYADGIDESIEADENRALFAESILRAEGPAVMTAYFTALDHEQHERGPFTPEVFAVLERIDAIVGRLEATARAVWGGGAVVAVASDHGFHRTDREVHLGVALRQAGLLTVASGAVTAWSAAAWPAGSSAAVVMRDPSDDQALGRVQSLLEAMAADPESGVERILTPQQASTMGGFPDAAFVVVLRPGYQLGYSLDGPVVRERRAGGMHGFPPDDPEMAASFLVVGPGVAKGRDLGVVSMLDIAPTLAALMGLSMPEAEGKPIALR